MLNIKPVRDETLDCFQSIIVSLAQYWNRGYILLFSDCWGFSYNSVKSTNENLILGNNLTPGWSGTFSNLMASYYGLRVLWEDCNNTKELIVTIKEELSNQRPLALAIDSYWCPWDIAYSNYHNEHYCLVIGIDPSCENLLCIDPYDTDLQVTLPIDHVEKGYERHCKFILEEDNKVGIKWQKIIENTVESLFRSNSSCSAFDNMKMFASDFENYIDIKAEIKGYENIHKVPLFGHLKNIESSRINFANVLKYLSNEYSINDLNMCYERLIQAGTMWAKIRLKLMKLAITPNKSFDRQKIADKIKEIADYEKGIAEDLSILYKTQPRGEY